MGLTKIQKEFRDWCKGKSDNLNWCDKNQDKVFAQWCFTHNRIEFRASQSAKIQGVIYASSIAIIQSFIEKYGEDDFKKNILEVKKGVTNGK